MSQFLFRLLFLSIFIPYNFVSLEFPWTKLFTLTLLAMVLRKSDYAIPFLGYSLLYMMLINTVLYALILLSAEYEASRRDLFSIYYLFEPLALLILFKNIVERDVWKYLRFVLYIAAIVNLIALIQFFDIFGLKAWISSVYGGGNQANWDEYFLYNLRSFSVFNNQPNTLGVFNALMLSVILYCWQRIFSTHLVPVILLMLIISGLIVSGSITGIISAMVVFVFFILKIDFHSRMKVLILSVVLLLGCAPWLVDMLSPILERQNLNSGIIPSSLLARFNGVWNEGYTLWKSSPIIGIGPSLATLDYSFDNDFIDKFVKHGSIGGLAYVMFFVFNVSNLLGRINSKRGDSRLYFQLSFTALVILCIASFTGSFFKSDKLILFIWLLIWLPYLPRIERKLD